MRRESVSSLGGDGGEAHSNKRARQKERERATRLVSNSRGGSKIRSNPALLLRLEKAPSGSRVADPVPENPTSSGLVDCALNFVILLGEDRFRLGGVEIIRHRGVVACLVVNAVGLGTQTPFTDKLSKRNEGRRKSARRVSKPLFISSHTHRRDVLRDLSNVGSSRTHRGHVLFMSHGVLTAVRPRERERARQDESTSIVERKLRRRT